MDYRVLLLKYIGHVVSQEGITFLGHGYLSEFRGYFTQDEIAELRRLDREMKVSTPIPNEFVNGH